jgi:hypothetical protein
MQNFPQKKEVRGIKYFKIFLCFMVNAIITIRCGLAFKLQDFKYFTPSMVPIL